MDRRQVLSGAGLIATAGAGAVALGTLTATRQGSSSDACISGNSFAAPNIISGGRELKMVTTWPKNFPGLGFSAERLSQRIAEMTDGQLKIKVFAAGELVPPFESFDAVSTGAADIYHGAEYYWQGKSKAFNFFTTVPFGMTAVETQAWIYHRGGQELWDELSGSFNIKPFMAANSGNQMAGWFNREIHTIDDFKGLKMRMPGLGGEVLRRLGASAIAIPGGEIFSSLQTGAIDATEWVGPWNDLAFGFYKVAKYYYYPGFHEPGSQLACGINLDVWHSLSKSQQAIFAQACAAENDFSLAEFAAENTKALRTLINDHGVQLRRVPDAILTEIGKLSGQVVREIAEEDDITKRVFESFIAARESGLESGAINVEPYLQARHLPFNY